ncbi:MAG: hypothetical protein NUV93_07470, partial [Firmicutes bacterium]|nr:hypothetical protein [Bacillota bacterium]
CEHYEDSKASLPEVGAHVATIEGEGKVVGVNVIKSTVTVELDNKTTVELPAEEVEVKKKEETGRESTSEPGGASKQG